MEDEKCVCIFVHVCARLRIFKCFEVLIACEQLKATL